MAMRNLAALADMENTQYRPYINTGGPIDIINGKFVPAVSGGHALSGGCGISTAVIGGPNTFKSTLMNGSMINGMARFPESEGLLYDSEFGASDSSRLARFSDRFLDEPEKRAAHIESLESRLTILDPTSDKAETLDAFFDEMKRIRDEKIAHAKDWEIETEILDPTTMKPYRMLLPTFIGIDSWTESKVRQLSVRDEEHTGDTEMSSQRMIHMEEGWQKSRLMRQLPAICAKGGIYSFISGHMGKKQSLDGRPVKKDMTHMGQDETTKAMGPKFNFLMSSIFKIDNAVKLTQKDDHRASEYPSEGNVAGTELQKLMITLVRCKNAPSGAQTQAVASQRFGIIPGLSHYDYLRSNKYFGLGAPNKVRNPILGDMNLGRTKIFDAVLDYKVARAMELTYQLYVIQSTWTLMGQPVDYSISIEKFAELLLGGSTGYAADDILHSRGWWTYTGAKEERSYLTLPDILQILNGSYKPKLLSANGK
jgi:hypothetical protein